MMNFSSEDEKEISERYHAFLVKLASYMKSLKLNSFNQLFYLFNQLLRAGKLSFNGEFNFNDEFKYLGISNSAYHDGMQVMAGVGCCRHVNGLLYDLMSLVGYDCELVRLYCASDGSLHLDRDDFNHEVVLIKALEYKYLVDAVSEKIYLLDNKNLLKVCETLVKDDLSGFDDSLNIKIINKILAKYYHLNSLGIKYVYDYKF